MGSKQGDDVPGNAIASQVAVDREVAGVGKAVYGVDHLARRLRTETSRVKAIRFRAPEVDGGEWLAVITLTADEGPLVAFVSGHNFPTCVRTLESKMRNGSLQWKEDSYG